MENTDFIIQAAGMIVRDDYLNLAASFQKEFRTLLKEEIENTRKMIVTRAYLEHPEMGNMTIERRVNHIFPDRRELSEVRGYGQPEHFDLIDASREARASARKVLDILSTFRVGEDILDSTVESPVFEPIKDVMRDSVYKDWLLRLGYENCMFLNDGGSFLAVLDDGKIMSGGNIMLIDAIWKSVTDLYFKQGLEQGNSDDYTLFGLSSEVVDDEGQLRGMYDSEYLAISQDNDSLSIVTTDRLLRILDHNRRKALDIRRSIDCSVAEYPGISEVIGDQPIAPAFDKPFKTDQDSGYKEFGLVRCDYRDGIYAEVTNYFYQDKETGRYVSLLPFPVSTFSLGENAGDGDSRESTRVINGVLTGELLLNNDEKVGFVSDLESKVSFFFKDGVEYSRAEFDKKFVKEKTNGLGL